MCAGRKEIRNGQIFSRRICLREIIYYENPVFDQNEKNALSDLLYKCRGFFMIHATSRDADIKETVAKYRDSILRFAYAYLGNRADAEDIAQEVFIAYMEKTPICETEEKKKAWLMQVTANKCKNVLSSVWKKRVVDLPDDLAYMPRQNAYIIRFVLSLDKKYRIPIHLFYYEGYSIEEIARLMNARTATVGTWLARGRKQLRDLIGDDYFE